MEEIKEILSDFSIVRNKKELKGKNENFLEGYIVASIFNNMSSTQQYYHNKLAGLKKYYISNNRIGGSDHVYKQFSFRINS